MTLVQLRYLIAIVDAGLNVTEAAGRVNATQSGMSQQLKLFEEQIGFQVFVRRGRKLERLSEAGAEVIERARSILAEVGNIDALTTRRRLAGPSELRILTTQTQAQYVLPDALAALRCSFPDLRVRLAFDEVDPTRALGDGSHDLAIVSGAWAPTIPNAIGVPLYRWSWRALVPTGHALAASRSSIGLNALARYPLIAFESAAHGDGAITRAFAASGAPATIAYSAPDSEVVKSYVRAGFGIGLLPEMACDHAPPDAMSLPIDDRLPESIAWAIAPTERITPGALLQLLTHLAPRFSPVEIRRMTRVGDMCPRETVPTWNMRKNHTKLSLAS